MKHVNESKVPKLSFFWPSDLVHSASTPCSLYQQVRTGCTSSVGPTASRKGQTTANVICSSTKALKCVSCHHHFFYLLFCTHSDSAVPWLAGVQPKWLGDVKERTVPSQRTSSQTQKLWTCFLNMLNFRLYNPYPEVQPHWFILNLGGCKLELSRGPNHDSRATVSGRTAPRMLCAECITRTRKRKPWIALLPWKKGHMQSEVHLYTYSYNI